MNIEYTEITGQFADGESYSLRQPHITFTNLAYGDMHPETLTSPRIANQMIGLGLLEAIPEADLLALADPNDSNGDGISGRPNYVWDDYNNQTAIGRFGWKANQPHLLQQVAGAFLGDMGITSDLFPTQECTDAVTDCATAAHGGEPEISADDLHKVVLYASSLAVPAQRSPNDPQVLQGKEICLCQLVAPTATRHK